MRMFRRVAPAVACLMMMAACGGSAPKADPAPTVATQSTAPTAPTVTTASPDPTKNPLPGRDLTPEERQALGIDRENPCQEAIQHSPASGEPGSTYIRAATRPSIRWGGPCEVLSPGEACEVKWYGAYVVMTGDSAYLRFQAWAKGRPKPFKEITAGPLPAENNFRNAGFPVVIPSGTKEVGFRIILLDQAKTPVAITDLYSYLVDCRKE